MRNGTTAPQTKSTSALKLVRARLHETSGEPDEPMLAGGLEPRDDLAPGQYIAVCEGARPYPKFGKNSFQLFWMIDDDGPHSGTGLFQFLTIDRFKNRVPLGTPYGRQCRIAMGGEIQLGDNLDPETVFTGKRCVVDVGFRKTKGQGGQSDDKLKLIRKANDFLRVHEVLRLAE